MQLSVSGATAPGPSFSGDVDDLAVARQCAPEGDGNGVGALQLEPVHGLNMDMGLGAVAGVAALAYVVSHGDGLPDCYSETAPP
jgi:hypothetical protein